MACTSQWHLIDCVFIDIDLTYIFSQTISSFLCLQAGTGIAELIALEISRQVMHLFFLFLFFGGGGVICWPVHISIWPNNYLHMQTKAPIEECRKKIWLVDSKVEKNQISLLNFTVWVQNFICSYLLTVDVNKLTGLDCQFTKGDPSTLQETMGPWAWTCWKSLRCSQSMNTPM